jgi:DNA polymerase-3 subunit gamma/tau
MPLQTVHRPSTFEDLAGNEPIKESLASVVYRETDIPHSYFFTGPSGCGKTTLAFILAKALDIHDMDIYIYDAANTRGIDTVRDIREAARLAPQKGKRKMYILDECHQLTPQAQEALLRILEFHYPHVFFVLCTTEGDKIKETIKRRCHKCELKPLNRGEVLNLLQKVLEKEGVTNYPLPILLKISKNCWGSAGQALSLLDSVKDIKEEPMALAMIEDVTVREASVRELCQKLVDSRTRGHNKYVTLQPLLKGLNGSAEQIRIAIVNYLRAVMLSERADDRIADVMSCFVDSYIYTGEAKLILDIYMACKY